MTLSYRGSREQQFLAGIWCASRKPPTMSFLEPIVKTLNVLATQGKLTVYISTSSIILNNYCTKNARFGFTPTATRTSIV